ncbi:MAG TPA: uracil-DNA glycosylase [Thermoanaerobaculia bacterium]|nr:uracil-DNA glycosylase [Thermoanaerobaculia bacterium]
MARRIEGPLADILSYLEDIGYDSLRRPERAGPKVETHPTAAGAATEAPAGLARGPSGTSLGELEAEALACTRCRLAGTRRKVVFGTGDPHARLMLIGEGPGGEEDRQGLPFVGPAGELLTKILQAIGLARSQVYIANIVKCRPPENRDPEPDEVAACRPYLEGQIAAVRPAVIVALGRVAAQVLLGNETPIGRLRGRWYRYAEADLMVTYHPAALLRNADYKRPTWEDMQKVRDRLAQLAQAENTSR